MYNYTQLAFFYCETPLHAGIGAGLEAVDLPIQRERATRFPQIHSSGVKGALRNAMPENNRAAVSAIFGPILNPALGEVDSGERAGMLVVGDARIVAFPVQSLQGVFVWATCLDALARLENDLRSIQRTLPGLNNLSGLAPGMVYTVRGADRYNPVIARAGNQVDRVYLEDYDFEVDVTVDAAPIAGWLADNALPSSPHYNHWQERMRQALVIMHPDDFRDVVEFFTEVHTRIALDDHTRTVRDGALWTEETLPTDTLLYAPIRATDSRERAGGHSIQTGKEAVQRVRDEIEQQHDSRLQIGGNETIAHGQIRMRWLEGLPHDQ